MTEDSSARRHTIHAILAALCETHPAPRELRDAFLFHLAKAPQEPEFQKALTAWREGFLYLIDAAIEAKQASGSTDQDR